jgi:release factor glutamine methyltransferase
MKGELVKANKDEADADWILCFVTGKQRSSLSDLEVVDKEKSTKAKEMLKRRLEGIPLDYITGTVNFYGIDLKTGVGALIPRPETELLCEQVIAVTGENSAVLDLMTGSGCIACVVKEKTGAFVLASDVSDEAIVVAKSNLESVGVEVVKSDAFENLEGKTFDVIVSNPPYIRTADLEGLQEEVKHEPMLALDGGEDGLKFYRIIAQFAPKFLNDGGRIMLEIGFDQANEVVALLEQNFMEIEVIKDLEGNDRIVKAILKNN